MRARLALVLAALVLIAGCGGNDADGTTQTPASSSPSPSSSAPDFRRYVALGDSYTAAPYVYLTDVADGCFRSNANYPSLVAERLDAASFEDVSCSGATTKDLVEGQTTPTGGRAVPQLNAVTSGTDLVTLGIGGNDNGLFASLVGACFGTPGASASTPGCGVFDVPGARKKLAGVRSNIVRLVRRIQDRAPNATILLIGYPQLVQAGRTCPTLPLKASALPAADQLTRDLDAAIRGAAEDTSTTYVDVYAASKGHDICAGKQAWINGVNLDQQRAAPFHPFDVEQQAVARLVEKAIR